MQSKLLSLNGKVVVSGDGTEKKRKGSLCLSNLELGIGSSGGLSCLIKQEKDEFLFTSAQFQELQLQAAIFKYIVSGLSVPIHLVLPVWKSVATSLGSVKSGFYQQFPSFLRFINRDFDYRSMMDDPEPERCRRTDGKKWRCYRSVVPHQKYCERHMHRGCQRSRKHVETSEDISKSTTSAINSDNLASHIISSSAATKDRRTSVPISTSLNLTVPCSIASKSVPGTFEGDFASYSGDGNWESKGNNVLRVNSGIPTSSLIRVLADKNNTKYESNYNDGRCFNFNHINTDKIELSNLENKNYHDASVAPKFGLSPNSVLRGNTAAGCSRLNFDSKTLAETEPLRCRRTDGKKWRCSRNVVHNKKYCETHLHRGAKKAMVAAKLVIRAPATPPSCSIATCCTPTKIEKIANLNTNLSISIAGSPQKTSDADSSSFSNSDATTVTDEYATISHNLTLSP